MPCDACETIRPEIKPEMPLESDIKAEFKLRKPARICGGGISLEIVLAGIILPAIIMNINTPTMITTNNGTRGNWVIKRIGIIEISAEI